MHNFNSVLIVDDDPTQIVILNAYFSALNVPQIFSAINSADALHIVEKQSGQLDLIVTDLQMPRMDGLEFMRHLKNFCFSGELAIISGVKNDLLNHAGRLAKMHKLNLIGEISKPLNKDMLDNVFLRAPDAQHAYKAADIRIITQDDFAQALANNEIIPYYQPKIEVQTGKIIGAESLARWVKPWAKNISPEIFIKFAEDNGRIEDLTFYLLDKVLADMPAFLEFDPIQKIAINLAPEMIGNIALPDQISERMAACNITSENISFEITENSILNLKPETLEVLSRLRINDFDIAIDDFGTGSSNIQTLRDFPFSELKIDRSFISNATQNSFSRETVNAAISLARELGMKIVAEGVEDLETWDFVEAHGIEHAQGYLMAKAMSASDYCKFLSEYRNGIIIKAA